MHQPIDPVWEERSDQLDFRFGAHVLWRVPLRVLSLQSNPLVVSPDLAVPLDEAVRQGYRAVVKYATPVGQNFSAIRIERGGLRYAARYGERYVVDLDRSFAEYQQKFSNKSRNTLKRKVKRIEQFNNRQNPLQTYRTSAEIRRFYEITICISHRSYKRAFGWGFREDESFVRQLETEANLGSVRGYVLNLRGEPAAYVFCRIDHDVIIYKHIGNDDRFTRYSPGTVLLYLILEDLFFEREFRLLDFDGMEHFRIKSSFRHACCVAHVSYGSVLRLGTSCWSPGTGSLQRPGDS